MWFMGTLVLKMISSLIFGGVITGFIYFFINGFIMPFKKKRALEEAIKEGRVVIAELITYEFPRGSGTALTEDYIWGYYTYKYGDKTRKFRLKFVTTPPKKLKLYYKKDPAKAKTVNDFGMMEEGIGKIFLIATMVGFVFNLLLG